MQNSNIEWTDHTFNPWSGCTKVSPGCANCYAESLAKRVNTLGGWGKGAPRRRTSPDYWRGPEKWNREAARSNAKRDAYKMPPIRPRVFCASLADLLDEEVPVEWLADLLALIHATPHLDWLLLTKRPQLWQARLYTVIGWGRTQDKHAGVELAIKWVAGKAPANVWIGTTVEDQKRADERIPELLKIPARVRFLSCEPMVGPVDLTAVKQEVAMGFFGDCLQWYHRPHVHATQGIDYPTIHWVIVGGESGHGARPMHPDWARSLRDQCQAAGVAFFFKQHGEWLADNQRGFTTSGDITWGLVHRDGGFRLVLDKGKRDWGQDPTWRDGESGTTRVGKSTAGRLLDGREWNELPQVERVDVPAR